MSADGRPIELARADELARIAVVLFYRHWDEIRALIEAKP
jgi:hypothetical protein